MLLARWNLLRILRMIQETERWEMRQRESSTSTVVVVETQKSGGQEGQSNV